VLLEGDGIGTFITKEAQKILEYLLSEEVKKWKNKV
jgi:isocitrate/isopropylmalate dehydrogenase